jgi:outer membrane protein insertion porin family
VSFPLGIPNLLGSLFVEAGTVGLLDDEFKFSSTSGDFTTETIDDLSIRGMAGASIFWESPFGPIRFDFTKPLKQFPYDERESFQFTTRTRF